MDAAVTAQHSGAINHVHSFHLSSSAVDIAKEVRNIVSIVVIGWITVSVVQTIRSSLRKESG